MAWHHEDKQRFEFELKVGHSHDDNQFVFIDKDNVRIIMTREVLEEFVSKVQSTLAKMPKC